MRNRENLQTDIAKLKLSFNSPLTLKTLIDDLKDYRAKNRLGDIDCSITQLELKQYLSDVMGRFFEALCLDNISAETNKIELLIKDIRKDKYIKFDIFESGSFAEANNLLRDIYTKWNDVQLRQEMCGDHISLIKKAVTYLGSLKKIITAFIQDETIHSVSFKNLADSKRFTEIITVSIDSYIDVLKNQISEISSWMDGTLSPKINMLMRADSSLRLLSKYAEWEKFYNRGCGDTAPKNFNGCGNFQL